MVCEWDFFPKDREVPVGSKIILPLVGQSLGRGFSRWHGWCKESDPTLSLHLTSARHRLLALALVALGVSLGTTATALAASESKATGAAAASAAAVKEKARKGAMSVSDIKKLYDEISKQRDVMIADFEVLAKQMKDATEEQKKQIKEKMESQKKAFEEATNALHKQIREEQRKQRQNAGPAKR
jgi:gas vesicle protein